jgi:hypothetical protein
VKRAFSNTKLSRILSVLFLAALLTVSVGAAWAVTWTYDGSQLSTLPILPNTTHFTTATPDSLFESDSGNSITINYIFGAYTDPSSVFGGLSSTGDANGNTVTIVDGRIEYSTRNRSSVFGGFAYSSTGDSNSNTVSMSGGWVEYSIFGGYALGDGTSGGDANDNTVTISGGTVNEVVTGGISFFGTASGNRVTLSPGSTVSVGIYGGQTWNGGLDATDNHVVIDGTVNGYVVGAFTKTGATTGNSVKIIGGTVTGEIGGGETESGNSENNAVTISGGAITGEIYGGYTGTGGDASGNAVTINGGTVNSPNIYAGYSTSGSATGNAVVLNSGVNVAGVVSGGEGTALGNAFTGNTLTINAQPTYIGTAQNFEEIGFGYTGDSNIDELATSAGQDVDINTNGHDVNFNGEISGAGGITKTGAGTLTLTDVAPTVAGIVLKEGVRPDRAWLEAV